MRLRLLTGVGALALSLAGPSAALAHHGRGHRRHHHVGAHHAAFRFEHIGPTGVSSPSATPRTPTPPPSTSTTPQNAGKVLSYEKEVLTITLNDGSTVSGKVSADTRIHCVSSAPAGPEPSDSGPGDDNGGGDDQSRGDMSQSGHGWAGDKGVGWGDKEQDGGDDGPSTSPEPPCDTSLLTKEQLVRAAELRIGPSGTEWESLLLVR
ncbi:MAG TPA: hypothetical protein VHU13_06255 [Solirubrobacteraceae bacterium]|jgi:hypothetical protein|nr:hypothetical protein [Solirubrobacteraceae bacterium]